MCDGMTDLKLILNKITEESKTAEQIAHETGYPEHAVKTAIEFMILRRGEYNLRTYVSKDGKTYSYKSYQIKDVD